MHQLEGFQYATALDIKIRYYNIRISPDSQDMTKIVTEFGKFRYNRLPMGTCASGNISQTKVDKLLSYIEGVKIDIDDIPFTNKYCFKNHIDELRIIFGRLRAAGLKVHYYK